ncbi:hypothetical protein B0A49_06294 [Cryomyces minteri]|uniref:Epoxide hydrolase N-terminal domain-containing protein n=1 Tax=Cryomyces minteri TaxID=331657 RepID=A0A4U0X6P8_9PEZI|nr:hypothetical protein B0A49_07376 [Cryomyces minteri]TKA70364.1 hypothetical protein B0A49_04405 [Cryomyces minteri]TKA70918.1 hypothetical protein B0A49_06294 [Cryomyces minteri]
MPCPESVAEDSLRLEEMEKEGLNRGDELGKTGTAIGEKFRDWSDTTPSLDQILEAITLYWLTETFPRAIYPYRTALFLDVKELVKDSPQPKGDDDYRHIFKKGPERYILHSDPGLYCKKPFGYSWNPKEIAPIPKSWAATTGNLGGHFAAMEQPEDMANDIEDFLAQVWPVE